MAAHIAIVYSFFPFYCFYFPSYIRFSLLFFSTLVLPRAQLADVMSHVGMKNGQTALYYMKLGEVLRQGSSSFLLSSASDGTSNFCQVYMTLWTPLKTSFVLSLLAPQALSSTLLIPSELSLGSSYLLGLGPCCCCFVCLFF